MKRNTEAKQRAGFGQFIEIPACVYATGTLLGILDYYQEVIYYVLPANSPNRGQDYVRCKRWRPSEQLYIPGPLQPWNEHERNGTFIPATEVGRVVHFSRGMFNQTRYDALRTGQEGRQRDQERVRLLGAFIGRLERLASRYRYWNLDLDRFVATLPDNPLAEEMRRLLGDGDFDMLNAELSRITTEDEMPQERRQEGMG
jgi:hypothetical protein